MNCPIKLPVYENGRECGTLTVEREGLYYHFDCQCSLSAGPIRRLYVISAQQIVPIGVMMPKEEGFSLQESISIRSFPLEEIHNAVVGIVPEAGVLPWRGEIDGVPVEQSWLAQSAEGTELYVPQEIPFPLPASLAQAQPVLCGGIPCLRLRLEKEELREYHDLQDNGGGGTGVPAADTDGEGSAHEAAGAEL